LLCTGQRAALTGNLVIIHAQAVALRIGIVKQARLQHFIGRHADAGHQIAGREGGLLDIGKKFSGFLLSSNSPTSISG
jgi:hypothetical protein